MKIGFLKLIAGCSWLEEGTPKNDYIQKENLHVCHKIEQIGKHKWQNDISVKITRKFTNT